MATTYAPTIALSCARKALCLPPPSPNHRREVLKEIQESRLERFKRLQAEDEYISSQTPSNTVKMHLNGLKGDSTLSADDITNEVLIISNAYESSEDQRKIYDVIIRAFKAMKMSDSAIYCALQNIPFIETIGNVIVLYLKENELFSKLHMQHVDFQKLFSEAFDNENLQVKFIKFTYQSIADYFVKNR